MKSKIENFCALSLGLVAVSCGGSEGRSVDPEQRAGPAIAFSSDCGAESIHDKRAQYQEVLEDLQNRRRQFADSWAQAGVEKRTSILAEARKLILTRMMCDIFPAWYGTGWDFNGTTQTPGEGKIACGYFVTTCLRDAGFDLSRVKLAQQPSQRIIETLADPEDVKLLYDKPMAEIEKHLRDSGPGLFIVGLDQHTGFAVNDGRSLAFVHASYFDPPFAVTAEPIGGWNPLAKSKYRVFGKILSDGMIQKWILGEKFEMK